jgi:hypothetical protein
MLFTILRPRSYSLSGHAAIVAVAAAATLASACSEYEVEAKCGTEGATACSGTVTWIQTIRGDKAGDPNNGAYGEQVRSLAVDDTGGVLAAGFANGGVLFVPFAELLLASYDASGNARQPPRFINANSVYADAIGIDPDGNVHLAGTLAGPFNVENCALDASDADGYLALLTPTLSCAEIRSFAGVERQEVRALGFVPSDGTAVVAGTFKQEVHLDNTIKMAEGTSDSFVAALGEDRLIRWSAIVKGLGNQEITSLAILPDGDVVITGWFDQSIAIGDAAPQTIMGFGNTNVFLARLSRADGKVAWMHHYGDGSGQFATSVATGVNGQIAMVGRFGGLLTISGVPLENAEAGTDSAFVALFDSGGKLSWAKALGGANHQRANAVAIDEAGDVLVGGSFVQGIAIGSNTYDATAADAGEEAFVAKLAAKDGAPVWFHVLGGPDHQEALAVAFAPEGEAYVGGTFRGTMTGGSRSVESLNRRQGFVLQVAP